MIENVLIKLGILNDHDNEQYNRVELFLEDAERAIKIAIRKQEVPKELRWICEEMAVARYRTQIPEHLRQREWPPAKRSVSNAKAWDTMPVNAQIGG